MLGRVNKILVGGQQGEVMATAELNQNASMVPICTPARRQTLRTSAAAM